MRILLLTMNPNLGASARTLQDWLLLAKRNAIDTTVCLRSRGALSNWFEAEGIQFHVTSMPWASKRAALSWLRSTIQTRGWLPGRRPDVIHCYEHDLWPFAWPLAQLLRVPAICHFHFSVSRPLAEWAFSSRWRAPAHSIWTTQQQKTDSAEAVRGILPENRQSIVPLGIDLDRFGNRYADGRQLRERLHIKGEDVIVGCACALRERKRVDDFLDVVERLSDRDPRVKGLLAGGLIDDEREYGERVAARVRALEARGILHWLGNVDDIEPMLQASDIHLSTSSYETFGMSVCEAMACAKPVAGYRGGSVAEVLGDAGLVVETGDLDGLTAAVERLVLDGELRDALGAAARQRVAECFNPRTSFEQLMGIYQSLVQPKSATAREPAFKRPL